MFRDNIFRSASSTSPPLHFSSLGNISLRSPAVGKRCQTKFGPFAVVLLFVLSQCLESFMSFAENERSALWLQFWAFWPKRCGFQKVLAVLFAAQVIRWWINAKASELLKIQYKSARNLDAYVVTAFRIKVVARTMCFLKHLGVRSLCGCSFLGSCL